MRVTLYSPANETVIVTDNPADRDGLGSATFETYDPGAATPKATETVPYHRLEAVCEERQLSPTQPVEEPVEP